MKGTVAIAVVTFILGEVLGNTLYNTIVPQLTNPIFQIAVSILCYVVLPAVPPLLILAVGGKTE